MARRFTLALLVVLALSVGLAGCTGGTNGDGGSGGAETAAPGETDQASQLQEQSVAAMEEVDSYSYVLNMTMDVETEQESGTITIDADGAANRETQRLRMNMDVGITSQGQTQTISQEAYQVEDTMYVRQLGTWQSQAAPENAWENDDLAQQRELLEGAQVNVSGTETVNGVETTVLEVEPDAEALEELTQDSASTSGATGSAASMDVESATVRQYIATDQPHYVHRTEVEMTATVDGNPVDLTMTMTFDDLDEDVTIDLPEDLPN